MISLGSPLTLYFYDVTVATEEGFINFHPCRLMLQLVLWITLHLRLRVQLQHAATWRKERLESEGCLPPALTTQRKRYFHVEPDRRREEAFPSLPQDDSHLACQLTPQSYRERRAKSLQPALIPTTREKRLIECSSSMLRSSRRRKGQFSSCCTYRAQRASHGLPHGNHLLSFEHLYSQLWLVLVALYTTVLS